MRPGAWWSQCGRRPEPGLVRQGAGGAWCDGAGLAEGFAEAVDVVARWSQPHGLVCTDRRLLGAAEDVIDGVDGLVRGLLGEVAVEVRGGRQGGVPQRLGDHGEGNAGGDGDGGGEMP